jgi:hypothetical protein
MEKLRKNRRSLSLLLLLLSTVLISSVSAAIYFSLTMQPTVTIAPANVAFEQGDDWPSGSSMGGNSTYVSLSLKSYPNATLTYEEPLNISNIDSSAHNVRLRHVSITPASGSSVSNFVFINFTLNGIDFDYTVSGTNWVTPSDMSYQSLSASSEWALKVETKAVTGATDGIACNIVIALDVEE